MIDGLAHHAFVEFDRGRVIEAEGELISVLWANPHIRFSLRSTDANGTETVWNVEGASLSILSRIGITHNARAALGMASRGRGQTIRLHLGKLMRCRTPPIARTLICR